MINLSSRTQVIVYFDRGYFLSRRGTKNGTPPKDSEYFCNEG